LLVRDSVPVNVANVPDVGKVRAVVPVVVNVKEPFVVVTKALPNDTAPLVETVKSLPAVIVLVLATDNVPPPLFVIVRALKVEPVIVFVVSVSEPVNVANVPDVGKVRAVVPVVVKVKEPFVVVTKALPNEILPDVLVENPLLNDTLPLVETVKSLPAVIVLVLATDNVPPLLFVIVRALKVEPVIVFVVSVSEPVNVANVPDVGKVRAVVPVVVKVKEPFVVVTKALPNDTAPLVETVKSLPAVIVLVLATDNVPPLLFVIVRALKVEPVIVLLVRDSVPVNVANVPDAGKVTFVSPVVVKVKEPFVVVTKALPNDTAPLVETVKSLAAVNVLPLLIDNVPPVLFVIVRELKDKPFIAPPAFIFPATPNPALLPFNIIVPVPVVVLTVVPVKVLLAEDKSATPVGT